MAHGYVPVDRDQPFLLPPDMREWLPEQHLVWFVLEVVARVDTAVLHAAHPNDGVGRRAYDPDMLMALLIYAYCTGQRSSRQIERLCEVDIAYRIVCANRVPDHTTIARFRQNHEQVAVSLFTDVLLLCAEAGLARVGVVAVDGTKIGADASLAANRTRSRIEAEVRAMFAQADRIDADLDRLFGEGRGDELPAELVDPRRRGPRLDAALRRLEEAAAARRQAQEATRRAREAAAADAASRGRAPNGQPPHGLEVTRAEAALARARDRARAHYQARTGPNGQKKGTPPVPPEESFLVVRAKARLARAQQRAAQRDAAEQANAERAEPRVNVTDPDSGIMKTADGWIQGYNAQVAVNEQGVILAGTVVQDHADVEQCQPMMALTIQMLAAAGIMTTIGIMLFDAGYWSDANATAEGPDRLIATTKSSKLRAKTKTDGFLSGPPPNNATTVGAMEHRLQTQEGYGLYAKRSATVEPVFGQHKHDRQFRSFMRRGLQAVNAEWQLINTTHNILKLFRAGANPTRPGLSRGSPKG